MTTIEDAFNAGYKAGKQAAWNEAQCSGQALSEDEAFALFIASQKE